MLDFYKRYKGPFITHYHLDGLVLAVIYNLNCKAFLRTASGDVIKMVLLYIHFTMQLKYAFVVVQSK